MIVKICKIAQLTRATPGSSLVSDKLGVVVKKITTQHNSCNFQIKALSNQMFECSMCVKCSEDFETREMRLKIIPTQINVPPVTFISFLLHTGAKPPPSLKSL